MERNKDLNDEIRTLARRYSDQQIWNNKPLMRVIKRLSDEQFQKGRSMFNNVWNALSSNIWPFTVAIMNLWAIGKAIWFVITFIVGVIKGAKDQKLSCFWVQSSSICAQSLLLKAHCKRRRISKRTSKVRASIFNSAIERVTLEIQSRYSLSK